jgi:hypothetical protein
MGTAKVKPVPGRKSSVPGTTFAIPDISSDVRRSSNVYGLHFDESVSSNDFE